MSRDTTSTVWAILLGAVIIALVLLIIFRKNVAQVGSPAKPLSSVTYEEKIDYASKNINLIDVTFNGETHEYVYTGADAKHFFTLGGHWAGCKYCKENN